jgi:hypothetical protein
MQSWLITEVIQVGQFFEVEGKVTSPLIIILRVIQFLK